MAACDRQVEQGVQRVQRAERERFQFLLQSQQRASTAPACSGRDSPTRQARLQHEQQVLVRAVRAGAHMRSLLHVICA